MAGDSRRDTCPATITNQRGVTLNHLGHVITPISSSSHRRRVIPFCTRQVIGTSRGSSRDRLSGAVQLLSAGRAKPRLKGEAEREEKRSERKKKPLAKRGKRVMSTDIRPSDIQDAEHAHVQTVAGNKLLVLSIICQQRSTPRKT